MRLGESEMVEDVKLYKRAKKETTVGVLYKRYTISTSFL